jgi:hypothetical protein
MEQLVSELKKKEKQSIIEVMAFISYNPSIGRVLEKGGVKKFQNMVISKFALLTTIQSAEDFDTFHKQWMSEFINNIKTNSEGTCTYGQAQKAINVFLKLLVDWSNLPDSDTAKKLRPFLHVPLDSILMKTISKHYNDFYKREIKPLQKGIYSFSLSNINEVVYYKWQYFFREKNPEKPLLFDIVWAINR